MIKVFTLNKNGKIELTEKELKELLDNVYWEGYRDNKTSSSWTYTTPLSYPYYSYSTANDSIAINCSDVSTVNDVH